MAAQVTLSAVTSDTDGTGLLVSGPCTAFITGGLGGGRVRIEAAVADTAALYAKGVVREVDDNTPDWPTPVNGQGAYYVRANLIEAVAGTATCTVTVVQ